MPYACGTTTLFTAATNKWSGNNDLCLLQQQQQQQ
jgi:hypothetical protein